MFGLIIQFDLRPDVPKYIQLYEHVRSEILEGRLKEGEKLPSVRNVSEGLGISKSTVENAYAQLMIEGYVESRLKSGYYVSRIETLNLDQAVKSTGSKLNSIQSVKIGGAHPVKPFDTDGVEPHLFNFTAWRKMLNKVMDYEQEALSSYGDRQGEAVLRVEIAKFVHEMRGVQCRPEQILVGAGVQSLFALLAMMFKPDAPQIAFESPGFSKGATIFEDYGFQTLKIPVKAQGINLEALEQSDAKIVYVSPAHQYPTGSIMPIANRLKLLKWAEAHQAIIIEDDYDSVLRYDGLPIPSLQGLNGGRQVIYVGAFSKLLMPSLRISFMILPETLLEKYVKIKERYAQTVSKVEQLTLAHFMAEGHFDRHLRKIKKAYGKKNQLMLLALKTKANGQFKVIGKSSGLHVVLSFPPKTNVEILVERMQTIGIKMESAGIFEGRRIVVLSYSGLPDDQVMAAAQTICDAIEMLR